MQKNKLIIAGGGTGGHVSAGIALAHAWQEITQNLKNVFFIGSKGGSEERMVPRENIPLILLRMGSLNRVSYKQKIMTLFLLPFAFVKAASLLLWHRPKLVIGVGGYASGPVVLLAACFGFLWKCRTGILEQNTVPGMTNRLLAKRVGFIFTAFPVTSQFFDSKKTFFLGNPIRSQFSKCPPISDEGFSLFVFGGSQGALGMNSLILKALPQLESHIPGLKIFHQTGKADYERVKAAYSKTKIDYRCEVFVDDMKTAYTDATVVVCRAGASSLTELAAVGRASVFIPLPTAADNHQEKNARFFEEQKAALCIRQEEGAENLLFESIFTLYKNRKLVHELEKNIHFMYKQGAAHAMLKKMLE